LLFVERRGRESLPASFAMFASWAESVASSFCSPEAATPAGVTLRATPRAERASSSDRRNVSCQGLLAGLVFSDESPPTRRASAPVPATPRPSAGASRGVSNTPRGAGPLRGAYSFDDPASSTRRHSGQIGVNQVHGAKLRRSAYAWGEESTQSKRLPSTKVRSGSAAEPRGVLATSAVCCTQAPSAEAVAMEWYGLPAFKESSAALSPEMQSHSVVLIPRESSDLRAALQSSKMILARASAVRNTVVDNGLSGDDSALGMTVPCTASDSQTLSITGSDEVNHATVCGEVVGSTIPAFLESMLAKSAVHEDVDHASQSCVSTAPNSTPSMISESPCSKRWPLLGIDRGDRVWERDCNISEAAVHAQGQLCRSRSRSSSVAMGSARDWSSARPADKQRGGSAASNFQVGILETMSPHVPQYQSVNGGPGSTSLFPAVLDCGISKEESLVLPDAGVEQRRTISAGSVRSHISYSEYPLLDAERRLASTLDTTDSGVCSARGALNCGHGSPTLVSTSPRLALLLPSTGNTTNSEKHVFSDSNLTRHSSAPSLEAHDLVSDRRFGEDGCQPIRSSMRESGSRVGVEFSSLDREIRSLTADLQSLSLSRASTSSGRTGRPLRTKLLLPSGSSPVVLH